MVPASLAQLVAIFFARLTGRFVAACLLGGVCFSAAWAQQPVDVAFAGFAYAGTESGMAARFPYSHRYVRSLEESGTPIFKRLSQSLKAANPVSLRVVDQIQELKGRDQALAVALVVGSETVVVEQFGQLHKLLVLIRAQAMFFDFKSMNVIRAYPLSFAYVDALDHAPSEDEIRAHVRLVYEGVADKPGVLARFVSSVAKASIPSHVPRFLQVTSAQIAPDVLEFLPPYLRSESGVAEMWLADMVSEAISTRAEVPVVPYAKGYAVGGVMSMRVSDGAVWDLKFPVPDYEINVELTGLKKIKFSEVPGGATSFVYGAYAQVRMEDALKKGMNTAVKNGETRVVPASQKHVDDFPHFYDAINGLFTKLALVMDGRGDEKWFKGAASAKDAEQQVLTARGIINKCK